MCVLEHCKCAYMLCGLFVYCGSVCIYACFFVGGAGLCFVTWRLSLCMAVALYSVNRGIVCVLCFVGLVLHCLTWSLLSLF